MFQNLNLRTVSQTEADSSLNGPQSIGSHHRLSGTPDASSQFELSRSNSSCSGISTDFGQGFSLANVKTEPAHLAAYEEEANRHNFAGLLTESYLLEMHFLCQNDISL